MVYEDWAKGEPNNINGQEDKVGIAYISGEWGWNDAQGSMYLPFICEATSANGAYGDMVNNSMIVRHYSALSVYGH